MPDDLTPVSLTPDTEAEPQLVPDEEVERVARETVPAASEGTEGLA